jgi:eukaryotic-like serine/threonine-protein kinase
VSTRQSTPPSLPGFSFLQLLGQGGYADVFLYEQAKPRRKVAVKVILPEAMSGSTGEQLMEEANTMASVSDHPFIVTIFEVGVAGDGRAYLVMEYFPNPNFSQRARGELIPLAEVLRVGVQVSSAVETAHRSGILHRDIKPANILTSALGKPALADFGISASTSSNAHVEGLSIPWSPPEIVSGETTGDVRSDVYSLGATIFTMLTGRSPFERNGDSNRPADLIRRILRESITQIGRQDVPPSLERLLQQTMAKDPGARPQTAAAFGRSLQSIEQEFGPGFTPLDVLDDSVVARRPTNDDGDPGATKMKAPQRIDAQAPVASAPAIAAGYDLDDRTTARPSGSIITGVSGVPNGPGSSFAQPRVMPGEVELDKTVVPGRFDGTSLEVAASPAKAKTPLVAAAVAVVALGGIAAFTLTRGDKATKSVATTIAPPPQQQVPTFETVPPIADLKVTRNGDKVTLTWAAPRDAKDIQYRYKRTGVNGADAATRTTSETTVTIDGLSSATQACFSVAPFSASGVIGDALSGCAS